jgi:hypothetical protein
MNNTQDLEAAAGLIHEAQELLKASHKYLADACQVLLEEIDDAVNYEDERAAHED